jgi:NAD(P)-dependent dehydrogenase (short-subunit alcohol dehydrogenase family)
VTKLPGFSHISVFVSSPYIKNKDKEKKMDLGLKDKVAVVTGTGSEIGFGHAIALTLAREGCHVAGFDVDINGAEKTAAMVRGLGCKSLALKVDVSKKTEVDSAVQKVLQDFGQIDILVNNAGVSVPWKSAVEADVSDYERTMSVNFYGEMNMVKAIAPHMITRKYGKIVNFSGGQGFPRDSAYGSSKGAVDSWSVSLAKELLPLGIYVNLFLPPAAETNLGSKHLPPGFWDNVKKMNPLKRMCAPQEVASIITFMVSDVNSFMAAQLVKIDIN